MNKLLFAAYAIATLAAPSAFAAEKPLTLLRMDLDGDGVLDVLRVVEAARAGRPGIVDRFLQIRTTKDRQIFVLPGLLRPVTYKGPQHSPCHSGIEDDGVELQAGGDVFVSLRRVGEASFVLTEEYEDNGCSYYGKREWQASLAPDLSLPLEHAHRLEGHSGMGSGSYAKADFHFQYSFAEEESMNRAEGTPVEHHKWSFDKTCRPNLDEISKQKIPACAERR